MNKKDSLPGPSKRKSSLGLRSWINSGSDDKVGDAPSISRPQIIQRSNSNLGVPPFSTTTRIPRVSSARESRGRRSSSQEPPSIRRNLLGVSPNSQDVYLQSVGMLITPVRPTPSRSPGGLSLGSSSRGSNARRQSVMKIQIPGTASKLKDERPVTDKMFQTSSVSRIQNFIRSLGVQPPSLKPLSNAALTFTFNSIMGELDTSMKVSTADYVEKIPSYLRALQYPSAINKSSYAAVGASTAGIQLIAMLAWLLDAVEALKKSDPENVLFPHVETNEEEKLNKAGLKTLFRAYQDFRANEASSTAEDFQDMLCQEMGVSRDVEYQLASEIESLQEQLETLRNDPRRKETEEKVKIVDDAESKMNELKTYRDQLAEVISTKRAKIQEQKTNISKLDVDLSRLDDHIAEIQDRVDCQVMKASERDALREESANLREQVDHYNVYFEKLQDSVGRLDVEMSQQRKKVGDITHTINCTVLENGLDEKLKWTMNPVQCENIDSYESSLRHSWETTNQKLLKDVEARKNAIIAEKNIKIKTQEETKEKQETIRLKTEELKNIEADTKKGHFNYKVQEEKVIVDTEKVKGKCMELQRNLDQYPKIEDLENDIKAILEENERIAEELSAFKNLQENFYFPQLIEITDQWQETLANYCEDNFK